MKYLTKAGVKFISETDVAAQHRAYEKQAAEILKRRSTGKPHPHDPHGSETRPGPGRAAGKQESNSLVKLTKGYPQVLFVLNQDQVE